MNHNKDGSALLLVIVITAVIFFYYRNAWFSTMLLQEINYKRYNKDKNYRLAESLFNYGISMYLLSAENPKKDKPISLFLGKWPLSSAITDGSIILYKDNQKDERFTLEAQLIELNSGKKYIISGSISTKLENGIKKLTISNSNYIVIN